MPDIDFVILWVDGNDPEWLKEKHKYEPKTETEDSAVNRYRDWGLLPYWFRAVEKYAPWVRRIHFVTWGHLPKFLNLKAPKLNIVKHTDFIPSEYLPTFSSHAIEMNLHRIPGLAEQFVYFNDDMFILKELKKDKLFRNKLPCTYGGEIPVQIVGNAGTWLHASVNNLGIINKHFNKKECIKKYGKKYRAATYPWKDNVRTFLIEKLYPDYFTGFKNLHGPAAFMKSIFEEVWREEPEILSSTCRNRFRTSNDVNQWLALWWQVASGQFEPEDISSYVDCINNETIHRLCEIIRSQEYDYICLNDPDEEGDYDKLSRQLRDAFSTILSEKSSYEL